MYNYELTPRLKYLTLVGQDDEGNLEFLGNETAWRHANALEITMSLCEN